MSDSKVSEKRILVVDDDANTRITLQSMLEISGYQIITANDGQEAIETIETILPDIILSDVMMPEIDGLEFCQFLKQHTETQSIPIILLTALDDMISILRGFQFGAIEYIVKPFDLDDVIRRVKRVLALPPSQTRYTPALNDDVEKMSLVEFLRFCKDDQIDGIVRLRHDDAQGTIQLRGGDIVEAHVDALCAVVPLERILAWRWNEGQFELERDDETPFDDDNDDDDDDERNVKGDPDAPATAPAAEARGEESKTIERKEVTSMASKTQELKNVLEGIKTDLPDSESIAIVAADGTMFASTLTGTDATRVGAMISTIVGLSRRACQNLKRGEAQEALLKGAEGFIAIYPAGTHANLGITAKPDANLGMLNLVGRESAEKIQEVLG